MNVHARQMDGIGIEGASLDDLLHFGDAHLAGRRRVDVEVACRATEHQVTAGVGLPCLHKREVAHDRLLQDEIALAELSQLAGLRGNVHCAIGSILDGCATLLHDGTGRTGSVERGNPSAASTHSLSERPLRRQLHFELSTQVEVLKMLVLAHV